MSSPIPARVTKPFVAFVAVFALLLGVQVASASAASISISPKKVKTSELTPPNYKTVGIFGSGFAAYESNPDVRVGLCTKANIGTPPVAPGCGLIDETYVISGGFLGGLVKLQPVTEKTAVFDNEHDVIPGQPATFDCKEQQEKGSTCQIVVVEHKPKSTTIIASADITFE